MYRTDDPLQDFARHEQEVEDALALLPDCSVCGEKIQDTFCYNVNDELICQSCMKTYFVVETTDYMG